MNNMNQLRTPLLNQLIRHHEKQAISFHVPGHKSGKVFLEKGQDLFQSILPYDYTELTDLDDLHSPEGVILEAELLLSELYRTKSSSFLVNGSTSGNLAMILATVSRDDVVLVQRNSHKSIMNGIQLANVNPVFLTPEYEQQSMVAAGVSLETVKLAIDHYPQAKALILTYPNYYGMINELKEIIQLAHEHRLPVLVDEAHGVHFISGEPFPPSAVALGADIVVQSAHKTLPAMTMGAFIHYNSSMVSQEMLHYYLQVFQSSSPSYPIMASLDIARNYIATLTNEDKKDFMTLFQSFRNEVAAIDGLSVLPVKDGDPLKMVIQSTQLSGFQLQKRFEDEGIYPELADPANLLLILPLLKQGMTFPFEQALHRIRRAMTGIEAGHRPNPSIHFKKRLTTLALASDAIASRPSGYISLEKAAGNICAETITPYPPGIPILLPGERIGVEELERLFGLINQGAKIQGGAGLAYKKIKVFT